MGENSTEIRQCGVTEGHGVRTWEAGALLCAVWLLQASVFLLKMVCGKIYVLVSSTKANCESGGSSLARWHLRGSRYFSKCRPVWQPSHVCYCFTSCTVRKGGKCSLDGQIQTLLEWMLVLKVWDAVLLMVPLGAQAGCAIVGLLQVGFEQSHWCSFGFQEMLLTFQGMKLLQIRVHAHPLCFILGWWRGSCSWPGWFFQAFTTSFLGVRNDKVCKSLPRWRARRRGCSSVCFASQWLLGF